MSDLRADSIRRVCAALRSITLICIAWIGAGGAVHAADRDPPGAFPYELAFAMNEFLRYDELTVSPDGHRAAYVVVVPPAERPQNARFLPNGTPVAAIGAKVYLTDTAAKTASNRSICSERGNQWNPSWSPDGQRLGFLSDADGPAQFWTYDVQSGQCRRVAQELIRTSVFAGYTAQWSPDGRTVYLPLNPNPAGAAPAAAPATNEAKKNAAPALFFSGSEMPAKDKESGAKSGDDRVWMLQQYNSTLAAIDVDSGKARVLVDAKSEPRPNRMDLSPSGRWLVYNSVIYREQEITVEHVMDLNVVATAGGESKSLVKALPSSEYQVNYTRLNARWHPTEDRFVYLKDSKLWLVDFDSEGPKAARQLAADIGDAVAPVLYFTKDGRSLIVGADPQGTDTDRVPRKLAVVPLAGGKPLVFALPDAKQWQFLDLIRANDDVVWQPDARSVTAVLRNRSNGEQSVFRFELASGKATALAQGLYQLKNFRSGGDHQKLVGIYEDVSTPPDVYRFPANFAGKTQLSVADPRLEHIKLGTAKVLETRAPLYNGKLERARTTILLPYGAKAGDKLPAIVMIYSGSDLSTRATFYGGGMGNTVPNQIFTSRGFAVVMANVMLSPEGDPSYPLQHMVDVLLPQVYNAANAGYIDVDRLAVSGQSFGGYSTGSIVSQTNLFRAAIPVNGIYDVAAFYGGLDEQGNSHWIRWAEKGQGRMGQSPWANPQRYIDNSPFYRIERINTPLLIVAGEKDGTVPYEEAKKFFVGLRRMDKPAQLAVYPGEGHVIASWSTAHAADVSQRMVEFLRKHLGAP